MVVDLTIEPDVFADQLSQETVSGGLTVVDAVEKLLGEQMEASIQRSLGDHLVRAPRSMVHPGYYLEQIREPHHPRSGGLFHLVSGGTVRHA